MLSELDQYFQQKEEPIRGCLMFLRKYILDLDIDLSEEWKYRMPVYCYQGKMFCYLWVNKKLNQPYLGIVEGKLVEHPNLLQEKRSRMKILMMDSNKDLPMKDIKLILNTLLKHYRK